MTPATRARRYWLVKSEPDSFSFDDLLASPNRTTCWDGVRNYQARNSMRDDMKRGDLVFFYGYGGVYHVAIYAGHGYIWHAPYSGARVRHDHIWTSRHFFGRVR